MENALVKSAIAEKYLPANVKLAQLVKIDEVTGDFYEIVTADEKSPAAALIRAAAMQQLRNLLTEEVMQPIMGLMGNKLGFVTDRDKKKIGAGNYVKGDGYPVEIVRDVTIWAAGNGARMVNNEVNILAGNGYLTREYFGRKLDDILGSENWSIIPEVPRITRNADGKTGAVVTGKLWWRDSSGEHTETLQLAIKGDEYASTDAYIGKFERKGRKFILERCTRRRYSDGEAGDIIEGVASDFEDDPPRKSPLETRNSRKAAAKAEPAPMSTKTEPAEVVTPEVVEAPNPPEAPAQPAPLPPTPPAAGEEERPGEPTDEKLLEAELKRRGEFLTVEAIRNFALDNGYDFDATAALENLDEVLETIKANGGR